MIERNLTSYKMKCLKQNPQIIIHMGEIAGEVAHIQRLAENRIKSLDGWIIISWASSLFGLGVFTAPDYS